MKEEKIVIGETPKVPEYRAEVAKDSARGLSLAQDLNTLDEPISTTIVSHER